MGRRKSFIDRSKFPAYKKETRKQRLVPYDKADRERYFEQFELPEFERICLELWKGRKPKNAEERAIVEEIRERKRNGEPFNFKGDPF